MDKLTVIALQSEMPDLIADLADLSVTEIRQADTADEAGNPLPPLSASSKEAAEAAARIDRLLPIFQAHTPRHVRRRRTPLPVDTAEFIRSGAEERARKAADEAERLLELTEATKARLAEEEAEMAALLPYLSHTLPLDDAGTKAAEVLLGSLPADTEEEALSAVAVTEGFVYEVLCKDKNGIFLSLVFHRAMRERISEVLTGLGFTPAVFRNANGRATAIFDEAGARADKLKRELARAEAQLDSLADNLTDLQILSDLLHTDAQLAAYAEKLQALGKCAVLSAWCPSHERARVSALLDKYDAAYDLSSAGENEKCPVLLTEPPTDTVLSPVLDTYSHPTVGKHRAALPLLCLYLLFFGLLFADVGYGVLTALLFFGAARFLATEERTVRAFLMLGCCGLFCIPWGLLTGNYFGPWLASLLHKESLALSPALTSGITLLRAWLITPRGFLSLAFLPMLATLLVNLTLRTVTLLRAGKQLDCALSVLPELLLLTGLALTVHFPLPGICLMGAGLLVCLLAGILSGENARGRLTACGGELLSLLVRTAEALQAARIALLGLSYLPVAYLISLLPLERGEVLVRYSGLLLVFLLSHLLGLALNRLTVILRRVRLTYMAHRPDHYGNHDVPLVPMRLARKYTVAIATPLPAQAETEAAPTEEAEGPAPEGEENSEKE